MDKRNKTLVGGKRSANDQKQEWLATEKISIMLSST
jgi:hypothetical protein